MHSNNYTYVNLRQKPQLKEQAATWFHDKWKVPKEAYLECMEEYLNNETEYGWYFCLDKEHIAGGLGVIEKTLAPMYAPYIPKKYIAVRGLQGNYSIWL